jgi:hypothetical protein
MDSLTSPMSFPEVGDQESSEDKASINLEHNQNTATENHLTATLFWFLSLLQPLVEDQNK